MLFDLRPGKIKDVDSGKRIVVGYPSTFGVVDSGKDEVERGAFARTIAQWGPTGKNRIKGLYQHDPTQLVGRPLKMSEDDIGLLVETQFSDVPIARDVLTLIQDEVITEQSIGYDTIQSSFDAGQIRHLTELRLYEYSYVTWGMNEFTPIVGVKDRIDRLEKALRDGHFDSEQVPMALESLKSVLLSLKEPTADWPTRVAAFWEKQGRNVTLSFDTINNWCSDCGNKMRELGLKNLQVGPTKHIPSELLEGLASTFMPAEGFFARCVDSGIGSFQDGDKEAFCAWLHHEALGTWPEPEAKLLKLDDFITALKEGRVLSARNQHLIEDAIEALSALLSQLDPQKRTRLEQDSLFKDLIESVRSSTAEVKQHSLALDLRSFALSLKGESR